MGSLIKLVKGAYGLREAPRLWYLRIKGLIELAGLKELRTAKACFVVRDYSKSGNPRFGMLILHVDDACYGGTGTVFQQPMEQLKQTLTIGAERQDDFTFLGRHVVQKQDFTIEIDQHEYVMQLEKIKLTKERISKPTSKLTDKELHDYRSIVGQLAWPARESMPQLAYSVSDLQQKTNQATIHDLMHAHNVIRFKTNRN